MIAARGIADVLWIFISRIVANDNFPLDTYHAGSMPRRIAVGTREFVALHAYNIVRSRGYNIVAGQIEELQAHMFYFARSNGTRLPRA